ncbi:MAG: YnjH family protein [Burkholderiaceae bacterium]|jgi:hypothetical protein|nr:YnjH family protein [Burkholderiaceae bacterium]
MTKTYFALLLAASASVAGAQGIMPAVGPAIVAATDQAKAAQLGAAVQAAALKASAPAQDASEREYLQAILAQLVQLNLTAAQAKPIASACSYEDKSYSEGAIRQVGRVALICVEREWGIRFAPGDDRHSRELVWEPVNSPRLSALREATGLGAK